MRNQSITCWRWFWAAAFCAFIGSNVGALAPARALAASTDGAWVGEAQLECDSMGDPRPPIRVKIEFTVDGDNLAGIWTAPNGEVYQISGALGANGKIADGKGSSPTQFIAIDGKFDEGGAKGMARGTFPGNLRCTGPWQATLSGPADSNANASSAEPASRASSAVMSPIDGVWRGSASLECSNMGDPRPGMTVDIEMRVSGGKLSGTWSTSTGDRYEIRGGVSERGVVDKASARLDPAVFGLTGTLKNQAGTGKAKGVAAGNLSCSGPWTVTQIERVEDAPTLVAESEATKPRVTAKADAPAAEATEPEKPAPVKKAKKAAEKPVVVAKVEEQPEPEAKAEVEPKLKLSFSPGRYVALVIGNNDYDDMPDLRTAVDDAAAMAAVLEERYGFEANILRNATRKDVLSAMAKLRATLDYDSSLLIYYAGHGHVDEVTERGYWLPVDAARDDPSNWISTADITDMLKASPARAVLVIADSCYSGTLTRSAPAKLPSAEKREAFIKRMISKRARTVFASGGLEPVEDGGGGGHSVFAKALIDTLKENADVIDAQTLFSPVRHQVVLNADQTPEYSDVRLAGHEGGDFVFVPRE